MIGLDTILNVLRGQRRSDKAKAVVTGAGSGIGWSSAEPARRGGEIICADISLERAKETVALIDQLPTGKGHAVQ